MANPSVRKRQQRRRSSGRTWGQRVGVFFGILTTLLLVTVLGALGYGYYLLRATTEALPSTDALVDYQPGGVTEIYSTDKDPRTGKPYLLGQVFSQYKEFLPITQMPQVMQKATIAIEDERFFAHPGIDPKGIIRALYKNARSGRTEEGASTLTQQLARNIFLNQKRTIKRKIQELFLAIQLEKNFSKEQILEMYLNEVCYGANTYGANAASKTFFGKPLKKLTIAEAALLAGLPQRPTAFEPFKHLKAAVKRRDNVLAKMFELGMITEKEYKVALKEKVKLAPEKDHTRSAFRAPYFTNYVLKLLVAKYGKEVVYDRGLKVQTTLNYKMQQEAERALVNGVIKGRSSGVTEGAIVSLEPRTGYIRAMVGGTNFDKDEFNFVTQGRRQPGSSFKPFVYVTAFASGKFGPDSYVSDSPVTFHDWTPKNYGGSYHGTVSLRQALTHSYNIPAARVAKAVGIRNIIETAKRMGIQTPIPPNLAVSLGAAEVTPLELTSAYTCFPNHGSHAHTMAIIRVVDSENEVLEQNAPVVDHAVVPESAVAQVSSILGDVVHHGTAAGAAGIHDVQNARGKTGTTNDNRDAWFVGYTPELTTAVWVCGVRRYSVKGKTVTKYPSMRGVTGGQVCAPIWARFMKAAVPIQRKSGIESMPLPEKVVPKSSVVAKGLAPVKAKTPSEEEPTVLADDREEPRESRRRSAPVSSRMQSPSSENITTAALPAGLSSEGASVGNNGTETALAAPVAASFSTTSATTASSAPAAVLNAPITPMTRSQPFTTRARTIREPRPASLPTPRPNPADEEVSATICADTARRATEWCPETITRSFTRRTAPRGSCRRHRPRPGDG